MQSAWSVTYSINEVLAHYSLFQYYDIIVGCGELWVTDGIWRLNFPHCMYQVKVYVTCKNTELLYYTEYNTAIHQWNAHTQSAGCVHRIT